MEIDLKIVGNRIRTKRERMNMTQSELAETLGYKTRDMISRIESGAINLPMDKVVAIADALHMTVSDLLGLDEYVHDDVKIVEVNDPFEGLSPEDKDKALQYIELLRSSSVWRRQNGMEKGGDSGSR